MRKKLKLTYMLNCICFILYNTVAYLYYCAIANDYIVIAYFKSIFHIINGILKNLNMFQF